MFAPYESAFRFFNTKTLMPGTDDDCASFVKNTDAPEEIAVAM
jgi:hypothetical protein